MRTPIHHYLCKGEVVRSCIVAVARTDNGGPAYRACDGGGNLWRIVPGGQVPETCLRRAQPSAHRTMPRTGGAGHRLSSSCSPSAGLVLCGIVVRLTVQPTAWETVVRASRQLVNVP